MIYWLIYLESKSMTPCQGWQRSRIPPPSNTLVSVSHTLRTSWANTAPFKGPQSCLVWCYRNYRDTYRCVTLGLAAEVARIWSVKNNCCKTWSCVCKWKHFLHRSLIVASQQNRIEIVTRPRRYLTWPHTCALCTFRTTFLVETALINSE